ncbi:Beta-lactamase [Acidisarcina polymorpha]|uniref:Beta-lactamase n=1 Tax=Acidisarcina polymorpha TaxID=2211140 RepID=A0A2Z5G422_9BACT|nr:Beta-lactamase [Acidisarcina polymorpha]
MGFYETWRSGVRWIGHEGDLIAFHSLFFLDPSRNIILFLAYNSAGAGDKPRPEIIDMFSDRYFPIAGGQKFLSLSRKDLDAIQGTYQSTRRADSTRLKLEALFSQRSATVDKDGVLHVEDTKDLRGHTIRWKPIGKDLWQEIDGQRRLFAIRDNHGRVIRLAGDFAGAQAQRVSWYENGGFVLFAVGASFVVLLAVVIAAVSRWVRRLFFRNRPRPAPQPGTQWLPFSAQAAAWVWSVLLISIATFVAVNADDLMPPTHAWDKYFILMNIVTLGAILLGLFVLVASVQVWSHPSLRSITKLKFSLVALSCLVLSWFSIHWHLIGPLRI